MTEQSTIHYERTSPQVAKITFANPPVNLIAGETVLRLTGIVDELTTDPDRIVRAIVRDPGSPADVRLVDVIPRGADHTNDLHGPFDGLFARARGW